MKVWNAAYDVQEIVPRSHVRYLRLSVRIAVHIFVIATFLASVTCHILTYFAIDLRESMPYVMVLHLAMMVAPFLALRLGGGLAANDDGDLTGRGVDGWVIAFLLMFIYLGFNFFFWFGSHNERVIRRPDGTVYLGHFRSGKLIREVTADEASWHLAHQFRGWNGHWVMFSSVGVLQLAARRWLTPAIPLVHITPRAATEANLAAIRCEMTEYWKLRLEAYQPENEPVVRYKLDLKPDAPKPDEDTWIHTGGIVMNVLTAQVEMLRGCTVDYTDKGPTPGFFVSELIPI